MSPAVIAVWLAFAAPAPLPPTPKVTPCCAACKGTGMIPVNDPNLGGNVRVSCNCPPTCACVANRPKPNAPPCPANNCHLPPRPAK